MLVQIFLRRPESAIVRRDDVAAGEGEEQAGDVGIDADGAPPASLRRIPSVRGDNQKELPSSLPVEILFVPTHPTEMQFDAATLADRN